MFRPLTCLLAGALLGASFAGPGAHAAKPAPTVRLVVGKYRAVADTSGGSYVVGFFTNVGTATSDYPNVAIALLDAKGNVVDTKTAGYTRPEVPPGQRCPFWAEFSESPAQILRIRVTAHADVYDPNDPFHFSRPAVGLATIHERRK